MGFLDESATWNDGIPYFEANAVLTGGPDCPDNIPIRALANRTVFLKHELEKPITAAEIPALDWGKITSGKPTTLAGYGIVDAVKTNTEGSIGVGVTPKTWGMRGPGLQLNDKGSLGADFNSLYLGVNWYCDKDGIDRRLGAGRALQIQFDAATGAYLLKTATAGSADSAINWKAVQRLDVDSGICDTPAGYVTDEPPANENSRRVPPTSWVQKLWSSLSQVVAGKADKATTLAGYGITDALSNAPATEAAAGILKIASQAQVNAGGDASVAVTPKTLKFGFGCSLTQNGYIASPWWLGGWVFQWAVGTMTTVGDQEQNITFPIAFPNECFFLMVSTAAGSTSLSDGWFQERTINRGWCTVVAQFVGGGNLSGGITPRIFAIGR